MSPAAMSFADTDQCGHFLPQLCRDIEAEVDSGVTELSQLMVASSASLTEPRKVKMNRVIIVHFLVRSRFQFFVDTSLYTRNGWFRFYLSSKKNKDTHLTKGVIPYLFLPQFNPGTFSFAFVIFAIDRDLDYPCLRLFIVSRIQH